MHSHKRHSCSGTGQRAQQARAEVTTVVQTGPQRHSGTSITPMMLTPAAHCPGAVRMKSRDAHSAPNSDRHWTGTQQVLTVTGVHNLVPTGTVPRLAFVSCLVRSPNSPRLCWLWISRGHQAGLWTLGDQTLPGAAFLGEDRPPCCLHPGRRLRRAVRVRRAAEQRGGLGEAEAAPPRASSEARVHNPTDCHLRDTGWLTATHS